MKLRWPEYPEVKGVFIGGCVDRGEGSSFRAQAHAHIKGTNEGWICVRSIRRIGDYTYNFDGEFEGEITKPSRLLMHELAHIQTGHGHDDVWRKKMRELKQPITRQYQKKGRGD